MALGLAFFRLQDKKETQTPSFTVATRRVRIHLDIDKSIPTRNGSITITEVIGMDSLSVAMGGNVWQSGMKLDIQVIYRTNNSGLKGWPCPHPAFPSLIHIHTMLMSGQ